MTRDHLQGYSVGDLIFSCPSLCRRRHRHIYIISRAQRSMIVDSQERRSREIGKSKIQYCVFSLKVQNQAFLLCWAGLILILSNERKVLLVGTMSNHATNQPTNQPPASALWSWCRRPRWLFPMLLLTLYLAMLLPTIVIKTLNIITTTP